MTIVWPEALRRLRAAGAHWRRRLNRLEYLAQAGRVNWTNFPEGRAYHEGRADAYDEAFEIIEQSRVDSSIPLDPAVVLLAQNGNDVETIANRCGISVRQVAEALARYAEAAIDEEDS